MLICYIRSCFRDGFIKKRYAGNRKIAPKLLLTRVVDLEFEMVCLVRF